MKARTRALGDRAPAPPADRGSLRYGSAVFDPRSGGQAPRHQRDSGRDCGLDKGQDRYKDMLMSDERPTAARLSRSACGPRGGRRGDPAAHSLPIGSRRTHGKRTGRHSRPVAAPRLASSPSCWSRRGSPPGSARAPGRSSASPNRAGRSRANGCVVSIRPIRS